ncbi:MAG: hypothetical protein ACJ777_13445 [Chloroflexota bacterium]
MVAFSRRRAFIGAILTASLVAACGSVAQPASPGTSSAPSPGAASVLASPTVALPSAKTTGSEVFDTATIPDKFALPMTIDIPVGWRPLSDVPGVLTMVRLGTPPEDESQWWGPDVALIDGARVVDPARMLQPASGDSEPVPMPADFVTYLTSIPGADVISGPEPVTIGGVTGTKLVLDTPPLHPILWLKGDSTWLGGGPTGLDPALRRLIILLKVGDKQVFIQQADTGAAFAEHAAAVESLVATMHFGAD